MAEKQKEFIEKVCNSYGVPLSVVQKEQITQYLDMISKNKIQLFVVLGRGSAKSFAQFRQLTGIDLNEVWNEE